MLRMVHYILVPLLTPSMEASQPAVTKLCIALDEIPVSRSNQDGGAQAGLTIST